MRKYLFFSSTIILTLALTLGGALEVKATVDKSSCSYVTAGSDLDELSNKLVNADNSIAELKSGVVQDNLQNRLDFVWVKFNILCMQEAFNNSGTYLDTSAKVSNLFDRYTSTNTLLGASGGTLESFNNTRWSGLDTEMNDLTAPAGTDKGSIAYQISQYTITPSCDVLTVVNNDKVMNGSDTYSINFDINVATGNLDITKTPATAPTLVHDNSAGANACTFKCDTHYTWNNATSSCDADTQEISCGTLPSNAVSTDTGTAGKYLQTWNGSAFVPASINWNYNTTAGECTFTCDADYHEEGGSCVSNTKTVSCGTLPTNSTSTDSIGANNKYTKIWSGGSWSPTINWNYSTTAGECTFTCDANYHEEGGSCVSNTKTVSCGGTVPANTTQGTGNTSITWNGSSWSTPSSWTLVTGTPGACQYTCATFYKNKSGFCKQYIFYNPTKYIRPSTLSLYADNQTANMYCALSGWNSAQSYSTATRKKSCLNPFTFFRCDDLKNEAQNIKVTSPSIYTYWTSKNSAQYIGTLTCQ